MPALATFLRDELHLRDLSFQEFARRAGISLSLAYQIIRDGKDNVRLDTFYGIASALSMTPAELMVSIGTGTMAGDAKRTPIYALIRQVPDEDLGLLERVVRAFVPTSPTSAISVHVTVTLDQFARDQINVQQLSVKEFARRSGLGVSHAYQILRGQRTHARAETVDAVARGLGMTPAEMAVMMGKGSDQISPDELELLAVYRQIPSDQRDTVKQMLSGLRAAAESS